MAIYDAPCIWLPGRLRKPETKRNCCYGDKRVETKLIGCSVIKEITSFLRDKEEEVSVLRKIS